MSEISAAIVKELRERTGAGMMDCKKALVETDGDMNKAIEYLREKGLSAAAKKGGRTTAEGLVHAYVEPNKKIGILIEVNCETDFVAKNPDFQKFVQDTAKLVAEKNPSDPKALNALQLNGDKTVGETLINLITTIGENIIIRRFTRFEVKGIGAIDSYIHKDFLTEGKIGVMLEFAATKGETLSTPEFSTLMKDLAMQVTSAKAEYVRREDVPADILEQEKSIYKAQAMNEGKPAAIAEKIMLGRIDKFYKEICLLEQPFVKDSEKTVGKLLQEMNAKFNGENISVVRFVRFEKGEGVEKKKDDFATEVMSQINN